MTPREHLLEAVKHVQTVVTVLSFNASICQACRHRHYARRDEYQAHRELTEVREKLLEHANSPLFADDDDQGSMLEMMQER